MRSPPGFGGLAKAMNRTPGATTVKAHMHMLGVSLHEGVTEDKGRDN
jgi:hypothetical protein